MTSTKKRRPGPNVPGSGIDGSIGTSDVSQVISDEDLLDRIDLTQSVGEDEESFRVSRPIKQKQKRTKRSGRVVFISLRGFVRGTSA